MTPGDGPAPGSAPAANAAEDSGSTSTGRSATLGRLRRSLLIAAAALSLLLAAAEIALRLIIMPASPATPTVPAPPPGLAQISALAELVKAHQRGLFRGQLYETNSRGLRDRDYAIPKPDSVFRIVLAGGSTTMGSWVAEPATYGALLETALNRTRDTRRFEVVNTGLAGATLQHAVGRLLQHGLPYDPDLIVYGFSPNDIRFPVAYRPSATTSTPAALASSGSAVVDAMRHARIELDSIRAGTGTYAAELQHNYFDNPAAWALFLEQLDVLAGLAARGPLCVVVLLHTLPFSLHALHPYRAIYQRVGDAARERGFAVAPSLDLYIDEDPHALWAAPNDPHANARSHAILARALARGLGRLPRSCWKGEPPEL